MNKKLLQYLKIAGSVLITLVALTQIWDWSTEPADPSIDLYAEVWYNQTVVPNNVHEWIENLSDITDSISFYWNSYSPNESESSLHVTPQSEHWNYIAGTMMSSYFDPSTACQAADTYARMHGYWYASIANRGDKALQSVKLLLPNAFYADIYPEAGDPFGRSINEFVDLWELQPGERVIVYAWTPTYPESMDFERIRLSHSEGRGVVDVLKGPTLLSDWLFRHWIISSLAVILLCTISSCLGFRIAVKVNRISAGASRSAEIKRG